MDERAASPGESPRAAGRVNGNGNVTATADGNGKGNGSRSTWEAMEPVAAATLIDAAATLDPADRALLNLWVNHGLPDSAVEQMTGMGPEAIADRRRRIVEHLSRELGRAPEEISATVAGPAVDRAPVNADGNRHASPVGPVATVDKASVDGKRERRRRRLWLSGAAVFMVVIVVALVVALSGGSSKPSQPRAGAQPAPAAATAAPPASAPPASATPAPTPGPPSAPTPGPPAAPSTPSPNPPVPARALEHAHGTVVLRGNGKRLKLKLTVRDLPAAHRGHYEVWLLNSTRDARALGRLRDGKHHLTVRLPKHAAHYRWIDISFQPRGGPMHPVESVLRSRNPARATRKQLRKRSARRRQLRRLASGSSSASKSK